MKIENGSRYQETEIVSYVQVINKAEIDRYLQRGKRKVCDCGHWGRYLEELLLPKDQKTKGKKERAEWRGKLERV